MDILREIITMDNSAQTRVESAVFKQKQRTDEFGENSAREREKKLETEREQNSAFRAEQEKLLEQRRENAKNTLEARISALDKRFAENGERWRAEILKRITEE